MLTLLRTYCAVALFSLLSVAAGESKAINFIDSMVEAKLAGAKPSPLCSEPEFLRRVTLDLAGVVPGVEDVKSYLAAPDREKLIDKLLASDEFDAWWGRFLLELTTGRRAVNFDDEYNGRQLFDWLKQQVQKRRAYDAIVTDLLAAKGNAEGASPVHFILRYKVRPADLAGAVTRCFLGTKLQCAQCHDHPFDKYTQNDFWGVAAFFARTKKYEVEGGDIVGITDVQRNKKKSDDEDENAEKPAIVSPPRWLDAKDPLPKGGRKDLAHCVVTDPLFAKNIVNRVWARLMGRGIVDPVDSFGAHVHISNPELLDALAASFTRSHCDLRALIRQIVTANAYQRSGSGNADESLFTHAILRPLSVDQLYHSIIRGTRYDLDEDGSDDDKGDEAPPEEAAKKDEVKEVAAGDPSKPKDMPKDMKKDMPKEKADEDADDKAKEALDEADNKPADLLGESSKSLRRALALLNQGDIHSAVESGARHAMKTLGKPVRIEHFEFAYLSLLSRPLSENERKLYAGKHKRADLEDAIWALLNCVEFKFNH
jgi:hypothetical protein